MDEMDETVGQLMSCLGGFLLWRSALVNRVQLVWHVLRNLWLLSCPKSFVIRGR